MTISRVGVQESVCLFAVSWILLQKFLFFLSSSVSSPFCLLLDLPVCLPVLLGQDLSVDVSFPPRKGNIFIMACLVQIHTHVVPSTDHPCPLVEHPHTFLLKSRRSLVRKYAGNEYRCAPTVSSPPSPLEGLPFFANDFFWLPLFVPQGDRFGGHEGSPAPGF